MIIFCDKCGKHVDNIVIDYDKEQRVTTINVTCHGEHDSMQISDQWQYENQDFIMAINSNRSIGHAFQLKSTNTEILK